MQKFVIIIYFKVVNCATLAVDWLRYVAYYARGGSVSDASRGKLAIIANFLSSRLPPTAESVAGGAYFARGNRNHRRTDADSFRQ